MPHASHHEEPCELLCAEKAILLPYDVPVVTHRLQRADSRVAPAVIQDQLPTAIQERGQVGIGCRRPAAIENGLGFRQVRAVDIETERVVVRIAEYKKLQELVLEGEKKGRECRVGPRLGSSGCIGRHKACDEQTPALVSYGYEGW